MSSATATQLIGAQRPRIDHAPEHVRSRGLEAIELAAMAGLVLDEWQEYILTQSLGETAEGEWSARKIGLMISRQNGKGALLEARELAGLFLLEEPMIVHTAHLQDTASSHFRRLVDRIKNTPALDRRLAKPGGILRGHGTESITLERNPVTGVQPRLEVRTRTGSGGLGFSINCLVFDEAMIISDPMHQALLPTLSAQKNMQMWYTGSAADEANPSHQGVPFARVREQGLRRSPGMAWFEWSLDLDDPDKVTLADITSEDLAATNPGLGIRISEEYIHEEEMPGLGARGSAVQRLGVGLWPRTDGLDDIVLTPEMWGRCQDGSSAISGALCLNLDVAPDRSRAAIGVAGLREDRMSHVEVIEAKRGTGWCVDRLVEVVERQRPFAVIIDGGSSAYSLVPDLIAALKKKELLSGLHEGEITVIGAREHAQACGMIFDAVEQLTLRHLGQLELSEATRGAVKRPLGESWAWSRKNSGVDISPLVSITLALWGLQTFGAPGTPQVVDLNAVMKEMQEAGEDFSDPFA